MHTEHGRRDMTAADYRREALERRERSRKSFESCDTDGFLSQWADDLGAQLAERRADLLDAGCVAEFTGLYAGDRRVAAVLERSMFKGRPRVSWYLRDDEAQRYGRRYIPAGPTSRVQKTLGLAERRERAHAWAKIGGSGRGLSGATSAHVEVFRTGHRWGTDAVLVPDAVADWNNLR